MKNKYEIRGDVTAIFIIHKFKTYHAIIDTEDFDKASKFPNTWNGSPDRDGNIYVKGKVSVDGKRTSVSLHRVIMDAQDEEVVDHINFNPLDNRKSNLRLATIGENNQNIRKRKDNTSGSRGVVWHKRSKKWYAQIHINGKHRHIGAFENYDEAVVAANKARAKFMKFSIQARTIKVDEMDMVFPDKHRPHITNKTSGIRNVHWNVRARKWVVQTTVRGKKLFHGYYESLEEAEKIALRARQLKFEINTQT